MPTCSVSGCMRSDGDLDVHFHSFPDSKRFPRLFCAWFKFCDNQFIKLNRKNFICSDHFLEDDYLECDIAKHKQQPELKFFPRLKPGALPTQADPQKIKFESQETAHEEVDYSLLNPTVEIKEEVVEDLSHPIRDILMGDREGWNIVDELLEYHFADRSDAEKQEIIKMKPPRPELKDLAVSDGGRIRTFNTNWYDKYEWLTGSDVKSKLFCWTCIIFPTKTNNDTWQQDGFMNLKSFSRGISNHVASAAHVNSQLEFALFDRDIPTVPPIMTHSSDVNTNRTVLKQVVDAIICLPSKNLVMPVENEMCTLNLRDVFEMCVRSVSALPYSTLFNDPDLYLHLLTAVSDVLQDYIRNEIKEASYFSLQFHNVSKTIPQIAITVRFTKNDGQVVERFYGIFSITLEQLPDFVHSEFADEQKKIVAQSFDCNFSYEELNQASSKIKENFPQALVIHNCSFKLDMIIATCSSQLFPVKIFLSNLLEIIDFVSSHQNTLVNNTEDVTISVHNLTAAVKFLLEHRDEIRSRLQEVMAANRLDYKLISKATLAFNLLNIFQFIFLLVLYDKIFEKSSPIDKAFSSPDFEISRVSEDLRSLIDVIRTLDSSEVFDDIYSRAVSMTTGEEERSKFYPLFTAILTHACLGLEARVQDHSRLQFLKGLDVFTGRMLTLDPSACAQTQAYLNAFYRFYLIDVNVQKLAAEMRAVTMNDRFLKKYCSLDEVFRFICETQMHNTLPELSSLLKGVLSLPILPFIPIDKCHYRRLIDYCSVQDRLLYNHQGSMLFVESDLLTWFSRRPDWDDLIINKYAHNQNAESEFSYAD